MSIWLRIQGKIGRDNCRTDRFDMLLTQVRVKGKKTSKEFCTRQMLYLRGKKIGSKEPRLTSSSAARIVTIRPPLGTTCANSPSLTVSLLPLLNWTRRLSIASVFNLPPARSLERSSLRRKTAAAMSSCSWERARGSSEASASFEDLVTSDPAAGVLFLDLSFFLHKGGEFEKACLPLGTARL